MKGCHDLELEVMSCQSYCILPHSPAPIQWGRVHIRSNFKGINGAILEAKCHSMEEKILGVGMASGLRIISLGNGDEEVRKIWD